MGYYNSIIGGPFFKESHYRKGFLNQSATYYWPVIFNNIIKLCTDDLNSAFDLRYYSSAIKAEPGVSNTVSSCCCWSDC